MSPDSQKKCRLYWTFCATILKVCNVTMLVWMLSVKWKDYYLLRGWKFSFTFIVIWFVVNICTLSIFWIYFVLFFEALERSSIIVRMLYPCFYLLRISNFQWGSYIWPVPALMKLKVEKEDQPFVSSSMQENPMTNDVTTNICYFRFYREQLRGKYIILIIFFLLAVLHCCCFLVHFIIEFCSKLLHCKIAL